MPQQLTPDEYLAEVHKSWPGDWEGDFDYLDGVLQRHDWGDFPHSRLHAKLLGWFAENTLLQALPSLTLQITPERFRVPDIALFPSRFRGDKTNAVTTPPVAVIEILSPQDTMMHLRSCISDYQLMGIRNILIVDPSELATWHVKADRWSYGKRFDLSGKVMGEVILDMDAFRAEPE